MTVFYFLRNFRQDQAESVRPLSLQQQTAWSKVPLPSTMNPAVQKVCDAAGSGNEQVLRSLLEQPTTSEIINQFNKKGLTPLHCACTENHAQAVLLLLNQPSVDFEAPTKSERDTPLHSKSIFSFHFFFFFRLLILFYFLSSIFFVYSRREEKCSFFFFETNKRNGERKFFFKKKTPL